MTVIVRPYVQNDMPHLVDIWNQIVEEGIAFPQEDKLDHVSGSAFFADQDHVGVAVDTTSNQVLGLYILHPNNIGRCGHIANTSYAVDRENRGQQIGKYLVEDSLVQAKALGYRLLQFNAVVKTNQYARRLYEGLGFKPLGIIPGGFRMDDGHYEDICPYYYDLYQDKLGSKIFTH